MTFARTPLLTTVLLAAALQPSCTGTETGNPPPRLGITLQALTSAPDVVSLDPEEIGNAPVGALSVSRVRIWVREIATESCVDSEKTVVASDFLMNMIDPIQSLAFDPTDVCTVWVSAWAGDLDWSRINPETSNGLTLGISGTTASSDPYFVESPRPLSVFFRAQAGEIDTDSTLTLSLDAAALLPAEQLNQLAPGTEGRVIVDPSNNQPVLESTLQQWSSSWSLLITDGEGVTSSISGEER